MAINKTFVPHTELKAQDLNDLVAQANGYVSETKTELNGNIATAKSELNENIANAKTEVMTEVNKKPNILELSTFDRSLPLPLDVTYYYGGLPVHSVTGTAYDSENEVYTDYIGICINHEDDSGFEPQHHDVMVFVKSNSNYIYSETFNTSEASGYLEVHVARAFGSVNATPSFSGLMSATDKGLFDDVVTEVFPLTVAIESSNAGTYEIGDAQHSVTPQIVLSITRKGADVSSSANTTSSQGVVQSDKKTIIGSALTSGTTAFQISVSQGGQTRSVPNQVFSFTNYRYKGVLSSKPNTSNIVAAIRALPKELSTVATLDQTTLEAGKYYLFAVKGNHTFVVINAKSSGVIDVPASDKGTVTVPQENGVGSNTYSWVIVPASPNTWYFQITNS